jgi:hypothetical protein
MLQFAFFVVILGLCACRKKEGTEFVAFDRNRGCVITIPDQASAEELHAAELVQETLVKSSGKGKEDFPIERSDGDDWEKPARSAGSTIYIAGSAHRPMGKGRLAETVTWRAEPGRVRITSYPADAIEAAAAWFLQDAAGARWFMPGELGEHIPVRPELRLPFGEHAYQPSYISRNLGLGGDGAEQAWWNRNRLRAWFRHGHAMSALFGPDALAREPELAPLVNGAKYFPRTGSDGNWQPNIASAKAAAQAAEVLGRRHEFSSAIGLNDSIRFDQSEATRRTLGRPRWFRRKPDYSGLYFKFVNDVARRVPGRYLGAYAYDWTENTPGFAIEKNVVPYLTADRSEWFDPEFAAEDQALIRRWVAAGPEVVGLYDYHYGAPFLVPRPTLYAVTRAIPFAHQAGARAFYAEVNPNWGLDGPKAWLAAELLWDATAKPADLLDIYYRDFWRESAAPMREFFFLCDEQWLNQPKPSYWIKYYKDEHQHLLFPREVRDKLNALLKVARSAATTELTRNRVEFTAEAFAVTDVFCAWEEAKETLSRTVLAEHPDEAAIGTAWQELTAREKVLKETHARVTKATPLAIKATILGEYERNDPRLRAAWRLRALPSTAKLVSGLHVTGRLEAPGKELLQDSFLSDVRIAPPTTSFDLEWVEGGAWRGHGEPYETRTVSMEQGAGSRELVMRGCKQETFSQMVAGATDATYLARVKVRAKVSPGNMTFLILNFQDANGKALGLGVVDRLPVGTYDAPVELVVFARAPVGTKWVGLGVRALNQVGDDYAAFSGFSLQALVP